MIEVYPVGTKAYLGDVPIIVTAICVRGSDHIEYEAVWWDGRDRQCKWVSAVELEPSDAARTTIGFVTHR